MSERRDNIYLVNAKGATWVVQAPDFAKAVEAWQDLRYLGGYTPAYDEEPESVTVISDDPVWVWKENDND